MSPKPPTKISRFALAAGLVTAALALSLGGGNAAAAGHYRHRAVTVHHHHRAYAARHWRRLAARHSPAYGYPIPPGSIVEPGYVFVPGWGILGEDCDMPTSTCTNDYRDVR